MSQILENKKSKMISLDILNKVSKSICKLKCKNGDKEWTGTGFFMSSTFENKVLINCLITNYNIIAQHISNNNIQLQIGDNIKTFNKGKERYIKFFKKPIDITIIEILDNDEFIKDVNFLSYDINYLKYGYNYYLYKEIFILQHPYGEDIHSGIGKIININNFEFEHNAGTSPGSSGSAVILKKNNCVIGIHKAINNINGNKVGTFIGELFEGIVNDSELQKRIKNIQNQINSKGLNEIENEEPQKIIFNSQFLSLKNGNELDKNNQEKTYKNVLTLKYIIQNNNDNVLLFSEKFVNNNKKKFVMFINNERFEFCHKKQIFKKKIKNNKKRKYMIQNNSMLEIKLKKLNEVKSFENMFEGTDLMSISGFSSFDSKELTDMSNMFSNCKNLISIIDIDFLNTSNVKKMNKMFLNCKSLESLPDISKWDTSNVTHIDYMFSGCGKLKALPDISKWNTKNIESMKSIFNGCKSLTPIPDISKLKSNEIKYIGNLSIGCENATELPEISKCKKENDD